MKAQLHKSCLLPVDGLKPLLSKRRQIRQEAAGKLPEALVHATVQVAARLGRKEALERVLSPGVFFLVRQALEELADKKWGPTDTVVLLRGTHSEKRGETEQEKSGR